MLMAILPLSARLHAALPASLQQSRVAGVGERAIVRGVIADFVRPMVMTRQIWLVWWSVRV